MAEKSFAMPAVITPAKDDERVGYGRPPVRTRFKPGQSGNPAGRPRGSRNKPPTLEVERMQELILKAAYREISVVDNGRAIKITMMEASLRSLATKSAKGDIAAQKLLFRLVAEIERQRMDHLITFAKDAIKYKEEAYAEIERREAAGKSYQELIPHPDDIFIDPFSGTVDIVGPSSWEEKEAWDQIDRILLVEDELAKEIDELALQLKNGRRTGKAAEKLRQRFDSLQDTKRGLTAVTASMSEKNKARRLRRLTAKAREGRR